MRDKQLIWTSHVTMYSVLQYLVIMTYFMLPKHSGQPGHFEYNYISQLLILSEICMVRF